jgi:hypothetical protein
MCDSVQNGWTRQGKVAVSDKMLNPDCCSRIPQSPLP